MLRQYRLATVLVDLLEFIRKKNIIIKILLDANVVSNGKTNNTCKTDDGRSKFCSQLSSKYFTFNSLVEIPLNSKLRSGLNLCQGKTQITTKKTKQSTKNNHWHIVCTCTMGGFQCEDQCETIQASTSIGTSTGILLSSKNL